MRNIKMQANDFISLPRRVGGLVAESRHEIGFQENLLYKKSPAMRGLYFCCAKSR
jgi:hypothetical protein